jgi:hypothetical protein
LIGVNGEQLVPVGRLGLVDLDPRLLAQPGQQNVQPGRCLGVIGAGIMLQAGWVRVD